MRRGRRSVAKALEFERRNLPLRDGAASAARARARRSRSLSPRGTLAHGRYRWEGPPDDCAFDVSADFTIWHRRLRFGSGARSSPDISGHDRRQTNWRPQCVPGSPEYSPTRLPLRLEWRLIWEQGRRTTVRFERMEFTNADASGNATDDTAPCRRAPEIGWNAQMIRVDVARIHRHIPRSRASRYASGCGPVSPGRTDEVRLKINGNLAEFPFRRSKGGQF